MKFFVAVCVLLIGAAKAADNANATFGNVQLDVLGQSGKFKLRYADDAKSTITVTMDAMQEVNSDGEAFKTTQPPKHGYNTFASQHFTVTGPTEVDYPESNGVNTAKITFNATLDNGASLKVDTYLIKKDGSFKQDNVDVKLKKNTLKWNFEVMSWPFCVNCTAGGKLENGKFLDIKITVKGQGAVNKTAESNEYDLGGGAVMKLNNKTVLDGKLVDMPSLYPKFDSQGGKKNVFTFRFLKFTTSAKHDPTVELAPAPPTPTPTAKTTTTGASSHAPLFVTVLLVTLIKAIAF